MKNFAMQGFPGHQPQGGFATMEDTPFQALMNSIRFFVEEME